jgi:uncharacterized membrane protein YphA (DoxX/SURF4 family)
MRLLTIIREELKRLDDYWFRSIPAWRLALFRIVFVLAVFPYFHARLGFPAELFGDSASRMPDLALNADSLHRQLQPIYFRPFSEQMILIVSVAYYVASFCLVIGFRCRAAALALSLFCFATVFMDPFGTYSINRSSAWTFLIVAVSPSGRAWSLDAWLAARRAGANGVASPAEISAWSLRTLQWFLLIWYATAGISKLNNAWSFPGRGDLVFGHIQGAYMNDVSFFVLHNAPRWTLAFMETITIIFEVGAPLWFVNSRTRPFAMMIGAGMHIGIASMFIKLWFFSIQMIAYYTLFVPVTWPKWIELRMRKKKEG